MQARMVDSAALKTSFASVKPYSNIDGMFLRAATAAMLLSLAACGGGGGGGESAPTGVQPTLASIQANIFTPTCALAGCHTGSSAIVGLRLDPGFSAASLINVASSQNPMYVRVIPGNADASLLVQKLGSAPPFGDRMPLNGNALPVVLIDAIRQWIDSCVGNTCP
jgi:hypothetical protein